MSRRNQKAGFEEIKDELTHPMMDAFGERIEMCAEYGRLSQRTDELYRILWNLADTEERTMTQEDFLKELSKGNFLFEDKIFGQVRLEGISCEKRIFRKCSFFHSRFLENQIEQLETDEIPAIGNEGFRKLEYPAVNGRIICKRS